jgi:hypothetical protein
MRNGVGMRDALAILPLGEGANHVMILERALTEYAFGHTLTSVVWRFSIRVARPETSLAASGTTQNAASIRRRRKLTYVVVTERIG